MRGKEFIEYDNRFLCDEELRDSIDARTDFPYQHFLPEQATIV